MNFYIGVTDQDWFNYLSGIQANEVNFWQPSGKKRFRALKPGQPFLFKLKSPVYKVVGGGFFVRHSFLPLDLAWEAFGQKNGVPYFENLASKIHAYRAKNKDYTLNPTIGCIILTNCFYFKEAQWLPQPKSFSKNLTQGRSYNHPRDADAADYWQQIAERIKWNQIITPDDDKDAQLLGEQKALYGTREMRYRLGQGGFRISVLEAYNRRCAITGERTLPVLESAHIKPYAQNGPHKIGNGVLLRSDMHKLFDRGYLTITPDYYVEVSSAIKEEFSNGREYYAYHGKKLQVLPSRPSDLPSQTFVEWHNANIYKGAPT